MQIKVIQADLSAVDTTFEELLKGHKKNIVYFYPKDSTSGCTIEALDFTGYKNIFEKNGIGIYGVSKDSEKSHCNFIQKQGLKISLIVDTDLALQKKFDVLGEKSMYGKKYIGTVRSTFLLDDKGKILKERRDVSAKGHVQAVMSELGIG